MKKRHVLFGSLFYFLLSVWPAIAQHSSENDLSERVQKLEEKFAQHPGSKQNWTDRITIGGTIESEAGLADKSFDDPAMKDTNESDIVLATLDLEVGAKIHEHASAHVVLLWEEDDTDPLSVDEGYIILDGKDKLPLSLKAGKFCLPFGHFESHMLTDPVTLELGEANQSAIEVGFTNDWINADIAFFNADVDEHNEDNAINSYAMGIQITPSENMVSNLTLTAGVSYISNLADSDALEEQVTAETGSIDSHVAGIGTFINASYANMFFFKAEYIRALDKFKADDLNITGGSEVEPSALNIELAYTPLEKLELALRYAQTDDLKGGIDNADAFPESQYGFAATYDLFDNTTVALEYLKGDYQNNDEISMITTQIAVVF